MTGPARGGASPAYPHMAASSAIHEYRLQSYNRRETEKIGPCDCWMSYSGPERAGIGHLQRQE